MRSCGDPTSCPPCPHFMPRNRRNDVVRRGEMETSRGRSAETPEINGMDRGHPVIMTSRLISHIVLGLTRTKNAFYLQSTRCERERGQDESDCVCVFMSLPPLRPVPRRLHLLYWIIRTTTFSSPESPDLSQATTLEWKKKGNLKGGENLEGFFGYDRSSESNRRIGRAVSSDKRSRSSLKRKGIHFPFTFLLYRRTIFFIPSVRRRPSPVPRGRIDVEFPLFSPPTSFSFSLSRDRGQL